MSSLTGLRPGFADPVRQSQQVFRVVMNATARPATAVTLSAGVGSPAPLSPSAAALLLALTDFETSIWLDGPLAHAKDVVDFITFHTGEDHFAVQETLEGSPYATTQIWDELRHRLIDFESTRLRLMDQAGIEFMVLSLNAPGIQSIFDTHRAADTARRANDFLADRIARRPDRFGGFAALPMQDPELAARELERCAKQLGFRGALAHGFSQVGSPQLALYYDQPQYRAFWEVVQRLDVPFYLHPRNPLPSRAPIYDSHSWLIGPTWAFGAETSVHALRLIGSGLFDNYPRLNIVVDHFGEGLPFYLWRIDNHSKWMHEPHKFAAKRSVGDYFRANFHVTTSKHLSSPALLHAVSELGSDRIMFSADYPFEDVLEAAQWFDTAPMSNADRQKIGRSNALRLLKLPGL